MSDGNLVVVRSKRTGKGGRRIAVDEHEVGTLLPKHLVNTMQGARSDVKERLPRRHDVEVIVGDDAEEVQYLIEHFTVLRRNERPRFDLITVTHELHDNGCHLDRLRPRAKDRHDFDFAGHSVRAPLFMKQIFSVPSTASGPPPP